MHLICNCAASARQPVSLPVQGAGQGQWQLQVAIMCVAQGADQQCELEVLSKWQAGLAPKLAKTALE